MIAAMSVVAAGFNKTSFCSSLANSISKVAKGSLTKVLLCYCILADAPAVNTEIATVNRNNSAKASLSGLSEIAGIVIFFGTAVALMLQASVLKTIAIWQICLIGAVLMIMFGVLKPREASSSIPLSMLFLI